MQTSQGRRREAQSTLGEVDVIDGYFTVSLDFGSDVFNGDARWLEIGVRLGDLEDPNVYTTLSPRQEITPTPYALYAKTAGGGGSLWQVNGTSIYYNNGKVGIGTSNPAAKLDVSGDISAASVYKIGGSTVLSVPGTGNTLVGLAAGAVNTGNSNTFSGYKAGNLNTTGYENTFSGYGAGNSTPQAMITHSQESRRATPIPQAITTHSQDTRQATPTPRAVVTYSREMAQVSITRQVAATVSSGLAQAFPTVQALTAPI